MSQKTAPVIAVIAVFAAACALASPLSAQQALKVGVINSQRAFETSSEGKKNAAQLQERNNKIKSDMARMDNEIKQIETKISTQRMTLSPEALMQLQSDLDKKTTGRTRYQEDTARDLQKLQYDIVQKVRTEMVGVVDAIAKEKGLDLVLDLGSSGVVYFNKTIEITDEVIKRYDEAQAAKK